MSAYSDAVLADNPHFYWRLGEASGTTANDESPNNLDGTYSATNLTLGQPSLLPSETDTCAEWVGGGTAQGISRTGDSQVEPTALTLECWFRADEVKRSEGMLLAAMSGPGDFAREHLLWLEGQESAVLQGHHTLIFTANYTPGGRQSIKAPPGCIIEGRTYYAVGTIEEGGKAKLYLNACLVAEGVATVTDIADFSEWRVARGVGGTGPFGGLDGRIDELATYLYALTADQIVKHYTLGTNSQGLPTVDDPTDPAVAFSADFAEANLSEFDSGSGTIVAGFCDSAVYEPSSLTVDIPSRPSEFWLRLYAMHDFTGVASTDIIRSVLFQDRNGVDQCALAVERRAGFADGSLHGWGDNVNSFDLFESEINIDDDQWQSIDLHVKIHATTGIFDLRVDGDPSNTSYSGQTSWAGIAELGRIVLIGTGGVYKQTVDELVARTDTWVGAISACDPCLLVLAAWGWGADTPRWHLF